jgi:hypothetical protein
MAPAASPGRPQAAAQAPAARLPSQPALAPEEVMQKQRAAAAEDEVQTQPALPACASTPSPCRVAAPVATSLLRPTHGLEDLATHPDTLSREFRFVGFFGLETPIANRSKLSS